ncbi:phage head-tail joining protein [Asticcacaulis tiandongensis]|uniref:phage head-tail joining protein n=1 Tax=Asticcacaulis tiandongensis TaxID=2565365 RepID=UPI001126E56B|nr:hypothetical protein [Asticcacaulis tiandongensis]
MASLSDLTRWRDALQEARFRGVRRVRDQSGEEVEYKSDSEMAAALAAVEAAISGASQSHPKTIYLRTSKGI